MQGYVQAAFRLILLLAVAFGVFGMHTIGHVSTTHAVMPHMSQAVAHPDDVPPTVASVMGMPAPVSSAGSRVPAGGALPILDPTAICLAMLSAVGLLALLRVARRRRGRLVGPARAARLAQAGSTSGRAPPHRGVGLAVAQLSVLRV